MAITLEHFCTKTGKPIIIDDKPASETIEHCLAEYFAPSATFKLGIVYKGLTTEADLQKFQSQGFRLEFAADDRFYFMDEALQEKVFDQPHFAAAYGSNMFTPCKSFGSRENLRVLVVDANTGENGGAIPSELAIKLVGDGDGKIDSRLHSELGNQFQTPFQTRFGIKERRSGLDPNDNSKPINETWQVGKGTFAPRDLSQVGNGYDLIISTDQLKGRKNQDNKLGLLGADGKPVKVGNEIKPGEYLMTVGIGNKTDAYYGITSTGAQFWNLFPQGVKGDVLPLLQERLEELKDIANDPRKIAQDYIESMDAKYKYQIKSETESEDFIDFENLNLSGFDKLIDNAFDSSDQDLIYRILKTDLQGHYQLLEHPKIIDKLQEHWREQYMDCATGRFIKFDSAMAQTCHDLAANEVCYPNFPDGAELIVYRSPVANSNTVDIYVNRHLPDEPLDIGTIKMSPNGLKHSLSDCDGDRMAIALAEEFPHTAAEIKEKQLAANRYAEITKPDKKEYIGSFEQITLDAMENKIGLVANLCMKAIALENECISIPVTEARSLMQNVSCAAMKMLNAENDQYQPIQYPNKIRQQIVDLASLCQPEIDNKIDTSKNTNSLTENNFNRDKRNLPLISDLDVEKFLEKCQQFYHDLVGLLGTQLQIEVDRGKSANRCDPKIVNACNAIIKSFDIAPWVESRKIDDTYTTLPMKVLGHGAIDMMAKMTNEAFVENALVARSTQQFQDLFKGVEFTSAQKDIAVQIKKTYDTFIHRAIEISKEVEQTPGPRIIAKSANGNKLEILGLAEFKHPNAFDNKKLDIMIVENNNPSHKAKNKWIALAPVLDENGKPEIRKDGKLLRKRLGYIASESATQYQGLFRQFKELNNLTPEVFPGLTPSTVKIAFKEAREFANTTTENIHPSHSEQLAAAMWQVSTANKDDKERGFKKASAVFAIFGSELIEQLKELQFTDFAVVGVHKSSNEHLGRKWVGEKVQCNIEQAPDPANPTQNKRWLVAEGKKLGVFRSESPQLPIGTYFEAEITSPFSASVTITSTQGNQMKVGQLKKFAFSHREWNGDSGTVTINLTGSSKNITPIALIDGKPLGVIDKESFAILTAKLGKKGKAVQGFQFKATLESVPATIANIKLDPETIKYPAIWTREQPLVKDKKLNYLDQLKPLHQDKYQNKNVQALLHANANSSSNQKLSNPEISEKKLNNTTTSQHPKDNPSVEVKRDRWEQNLINASFAAIKANPANQEAVLRTAPLASKYVAIYNTQKETLSIMNDNQEVIYQATKNKEASINKLTAEERKYWQNQAKPIREQKSQGLTNSD